MSEPQKIPDRKFSSSFAHESEERIAGLLDFTELNGNMSPQLLFWNEILKVNQDQHSHLIFSYLNTICT